MNILQVKSIELTTILCVRCSFWRSLPFQACFAITVIVIFVILDEDKAGHSDFDHCPRGVGLRP